MQAFKTIITKQSTKPHKNVYGIKLHVCCDRHWVRTVCVCVCLCVHMCVCACVHVCVCVCVCVCRAADELVSVFSGQGGMCGNIRASHVCSMGP